LDKRTPSVGRFEPDDDDDDDGDLLQRAATAGEARLMTMARAVADGTATDVQVLRLMGVLNQAQTNARLDGIASLLMSGRPDQAHDMARGMIGMPPLHG